MGTNGRSNPTMLDVARAAGVSRALVSIVMRGVPGAKEETRAQVLQVAAELGYVLDARAQSLRAGRRAIGVVFQPDQKFHASLIDGIYSHAERHGIQVVLSAVIGRRSEQAAIESLVANRCGVVITLGTRLSGTLLASHAERLPVVAVAKAIHAPGVDSVCSADAEGLDQAVNHLVRLGHNRIWFCSSPGSGGNTQRTQGYRRSMTAHNLDRNIKILASGSNEERGARTAAVVLDSVEPPTALIAFNDACASGLQSVLVRAGVRIPEDLSLIGFDDSEIAAISYRQLTTVRQDIDVLSREAVERAVTRMGGEPELTDTRIVPVSLVVRATTGTPRDRLDLRAL